MSKVKLNIFSISKNNILSIIGFSLCHTFFLSLSSLLAEPSPGLLRTLPIYDHRHYVSAMKILYVIEIYDIFFGHSELIYWIPIYGNGFLLFLVVECNNPIENILNCLTVMIYSSIKSWAGRWLNWYVTKSLKIHKSLTNYLNIKNYTIFGKQNFWIFQICYQKC